MGSHKNHNNAALLCNLKPWDNNLSSVWLGSTLTLNRNLEKFKFPVKLDAERKLQVVALLSRDVISFDQAKKAELFKAEELSLHTKEFLGEHFLTMFDFKQASTGEAFILDETGEFVVVFNLKDHLMIHLIDPREELEKTWERLTKIEAAVTSSVSFAYSPKFGFLTSDPTQCGTGLLVHIFLHLPALIYTEKLVEVVNKYKDEGVEQTGLQGDPAILIGDIVVFHNNYTLGVTEENIISSMRTLATKIMLEEKSARNGLIHLPENGHLHLKDKVSRAYGILLHSYQLEAIEALEAISLLKLGLEIGWIQGTSIGNLNQLFFNTRRAHLLCHYGEKVSQEDVPRKRAEFIHQKLAGTSLLI